MKRKQSIYFSCLVAFACSAHAQDAVVPTNNIPPTEVPYSSEFQTRLVQNLSHDDAALFLLANRALSNPNDIVLDQGVQRRLIEVVFQEISTRLQPGCSTIKRTTALQSLGLLINSSSVSKTPDLFEGVLDQIQQSTAIVSDSGTRMTILDQLQGVTKQMVASFTAKSAEIAALANSLDAKQIERDALKSEIEFIEKFAAGEAKVAADQLFDSPKYWDQAVSKLSGYVSIPNPLILPTTPPTTPTPNLKEEDLAQMVNVTDEYKPIHNMLFAAEKRKRELDLLIPKIDSDTRITKLLLNIYDQKLKLARLDAEVTKLNNATIAGKSEFKVLTKRFQHRTLRIRTFVRCFADASSTRVARDTAMNVEYELHKALLAYEGPNAFLESYVTTEKPANGKYAISNEIGAATSAGDLPTVSNSVKSAGERPGVSNTAPFDPASTPVSPYTRPSIPTHYPLTDDQGKRFPSAPSTDQDEDVTPIKAQGATPASGAQGARPAVDPM